MWKNITEKSGVGYMHEIIGFENVHKYYKISGKVLKVLRDINFSLEKGKILSVIGESGSGKTTLAMIASFLEEPTKGNVIFKGKIVDAKTSRKFLWREVQLIFQDPGRTLNPKKSVDFLLKEPLINYSVCTKNEMEKRVDYLMDSVGLARFIKMKKAEELSGGEKQRIAIARALSVSPSLLILDEPFSFLDSLVKAQLLSILMDFRNKNKIAWIYITHEIEDISNLSDSVIVLYRGLIMEKGKPDILQNPYHPYTKFLLSPSFKEEYRTFVDQGCPFFVKCIFKKELCKYSIPELKLVNERYVRCHLY